MKLKITKRNRMRLDAVLDGTTEFVPLIDLDPAYIRPRMNYITDKKEELNIFDKNIVMDGIEFPLTAENGQIVRKDGRTYIYRKEEEEVPTVRVVEVEGSNFYPSMQNTFASLLVGLVFEVLAPVRNIKCIIYAGESGLVFSYAITKAGETVFSDSIIAVEGANFLAMNIELEPGMYEIKNTQPLKGKGFGWKMNPRAYPHASERLIILDSTYSTNRYHWFFNWSYEIHE